MDSIIRTVAFMKKEVFEIFHQPRLIATVVLGPFVILFLFGIGYRNEGRALRTVFVAPEGDPINKEIQRLAPYLGKQIVFSGITTEMEHARKKLKDGDVDLVVLAPSDSVETVRSNRQAVFYLYHNEIDPYQADYIRFTGELYVDKLNHWLLTTAVEDRKGHASVLHADLKQTGGATKQLREALERGDVEAARRHQETLKQRLQAMEANFRLQMRGVGSQTDAGAQEQLQAVLSSISAARRSIEDMSQIEPGRSDYTTESQKALQLEKDILLAETKLGEIRSIDPRILFSPFRSNTEGIVRSQPQLSEYFTPSVIILLLQHLAITFAALSLVRELKTSTIELFRVSPLRPAELLVGKLVGYMIVGAVVATVLTALLLFTLRMPMHGNWYSYAAVLLALFFTSLAAGFLMSLVAKTESQAIQYSMILLLMSIFFTGFLLDLRMLWEPVRTVSWALPATYGIQLLQDIMLRGSAPEPFLLGVLSGMGVFLFVADLKLLSKRLLR